MKNYTFINVDVSGIPELKMAIYLSGLAPKKLRTCNLASSRILPGAE